MVGQQLRFEQPGHRLDAYPAVAGFLGDEPGDAAGAVAARLGLAAIGVQDAQRHLRRGLARWLDQEQLVAPDGPSLPIGELYGKTIAFNVLALQGQPGGRRLSREPL